MAVADARTTSLRREAPTTFYSAMSLLALGVSLTGFATTFFAPVLLGRFAAPPVVWLHGAFAFGWVLLFVAQPLLVRRRAFDVHRALGTVGVLLAVAVAGTGVATGVYATTRDFAGGGGETAISGLLGTITSMLMFLALVAGAIANRSRGDVHRRLMLLATIVLIWPAWFRFRHYFPSVPRPDVVFAVVAADSLIALAMLRDRFVLGRVHPVYAWVGTAIVAEHALEVALFDSPPWRTAAQWLYRSLG